MKLISHIFFYVYVGVVLIAGFWGAFINPVFDFKFLFHADIYTLPAPFRINLLSQYRFLRALELGYGIFSILFRKQIFETTLYNRLFLAIMGSGILSRIVSIIADGSPNTLFYFFLIYEAVAFFFIILYTKDQFFRSGNNFSSGVRS